MPTSDQRDKDRGQDKGRNPGQGLAGVTDQERRDLAGSTDDAPTRDQASRPTSGGPRAQRDPGRTPKH